MVTTPSFPRVLIGLSPDLNSRFIRLVLGELRLPFDLRDPRGDGQGLDHIPTLHDENGTQITYAAVIAEYLDEGYGAPFHHSLIGIDPIDRARVRQIWRFIDGPVADRVTTLMYERVHRRAVGGTPDWLLSNGPARPNPTTSKNSRGSLIKTPGSRGRI